MNDLHGCNCKEGSWSAILDTMPPGKPRLRVTGVCTCRTSGFKAHLQKSEPQGFNPSILLLRLTTAPPSGAANDVITDYDVRYDEPDSPRYTQVTILPCDITIPVEVVS